MNLLFALVVPFLLSLFRYSFLYFAMCSFLCSLCLSFVLSVLLYLFMSLFLPPCISLLFLYYVLYLRRHVVRVPLFRSLFMYVGLS